MKQIILFIIISISLISCSVDPEIIPIVTKDDIKIIVPNGWPTPNYNFENNPLTVDGFNLGRTLFYDPILSADNTISCGTCHQQFAAFSNAGHSVSHGINSLLGTRNAPAIQNVNWQTNFMHDGGIINIEVMPLAPITNTVEMAETMTGLITKLTNSGKYKQLFTKAFGDETVNSEKIFKALAQFMGMLYSYNSKYDNVKNGKATFTSSEESGYNLFKLKCASCHIEPLFADNGYHNIGLSINMSFNDSGRAHITSNPLDKYKFRTPSLRNIEKTSPYMHDGRFVTLEECIEHYNSGVINSPTLDFQLNNGIPLTAQEQTDLIAFLKTLTDQKYLTNPLFSDNNH